MADLPLAAGIAVLSLIGLISALVGDERWDALSWLGLGTLAVAMTALHRRRPHG